MKSQFYKNYRGVIMNLAFILSVSIYHLLFKKYIFAEANYYFHDNTSVIKNNPFAIFLLVIIILDFYAFILKYKHIRHVFFQNLIYYEGPKGCLNELNESIIGFAALIHLVNTVFIVILITNAMDINFIIIPFILFIIFKEIFIFIQVMQLEMHQSTDDDPGKKILPVDISDNKKILSDILLTFSSTIIYTVTWEVCVNNIGLKPTDFSWIVFIGLFVLSIIVFLPSRLTFIMQDYYASTEPKYKRYAFFSSIATILISTLTALFSI